MQSAARAIFREALAECSIEKAFARNLDYSHGVLRICEDLYDLRSYSRVFVVSLGKAGHRMAEALARHAGTLAQGIVVDPNPSLQQLPGYRYFAGGHPQPNSESLDAAKAILKSLTALDQSALALFMISGGGSAAVEYPVDEEISLSDLMATYKTLVLSGAPIAQINAIRKHLSAVKGGRLARAAHPAQQVSILVSDVPETALDSLASGPTLPDSSTTDECHRIAADYKMLESFPGSVRELFERHALEETPKKDDLAFHRSRWWKVLSSETAEQAAAVAARRQGFTVEIDHTCDDWDYASAADYLLGRLRALRRPSERVCLISGGEITVKVPLHSGRGGRNQHFTLYCARKIAGEDITVLSAGTDGIDGNSPAAGALADGTTATRGHTAGLNPEVYFSAFDSFEFFESLGDTIHTGPTGTNVRDLRILIG
jgi:hydroxypyruvate reductase